MKLFYSLIEIVRPKALIILALSSVAGFLAPHAAAQPQTLSVGPDHSTAQVFIGTRENPKSLNIGVGRVSGTVRMDRDNLDLSIVNFQIYAANESPARDADRQALAGDQPVISFRSTHFAERSDGTLEVVGLLTVTQAEHTVVASTGEDYSGPAYGPARLLHETREVTFVFAPLAADSSSSSSLSSSSRSGDAHLLKAQQALSGAAVLLMASATVSGESFPVLMTSIRNAAWPAVVNHVECTNPSPVGEDYSGLRCSESVIAASGSPVAPVQVGEDYSGPRIEPPQGNLVTIDLGLALTSSSPSSTADKQERPGSFGKAVN